VYEILRLAEICRDNAVEYKEYRLEVKNRLNAPFETEKLKAEKLSQKMPLADIKDLLDSVRIAETNRVETLDAAYKKLEEEYDKVIKRLTAC